MLGCVPINSAPLYQTGLGGLRIFKSRFFLGGMCSQGQLSTSLGTGLKAFFLKRLIVLFHSKVIECVVIFHRLLLGHPAPYSLDQLSPPSAPQMKVKFSLCLSGYQLCPAGIQSAHKLGWTMWLLPEQVEWYTHLEWLYFLLVVSRVSSPVHRQAGKQAQSKILSPGKLVGPGQSGTFRTHCAVFALSFCSSEMKKCKKDNKKTRETAV
jgi:hypothetical protein